MVNLKTFKFNKVDLYALLVLFFFFCISLLSVARISFFGFEQTPKALTSDEVSHIASGYYYLTEGKMFLNTEHPPLAKDVAAFPLLFMNIKSPEIVENPQGPVYKEFPKKWELDNEQWKWGRAVIFHPENNPESIAFWSRVSSTTFNTFLLGILYIFIKKTFSNKAAFISLFLLSTTATIIAHASLANTDISSSIFLALSILSFGNFYKKFINQEKAYKEVFFVILFSSLACLTKFNSLILFPFFLVGFLPLLFKKRNLIKSFILYFILICISSAILITLIYIPHTINMSASDMLIALDRYYGLEPDKMRRPLGDILAFFVNGNFITRAILGYVKGLGLVYWRLKMHEQEVYFLGNFYINQSTGPLYTPVLFFTKISSVFFLLILPAFFFAIKNLIDKKKKVLSVLNKQNISFLILLLFSFVYLLISINTKLQIGLRHSMPFIFSFFILSGILIAKFWDKEIFRNFKIKTLFFISSIFLFLSLLTSFPDYISYYNIVPKVFGKQGYEIANDSNYDWGQDVIKLSEWAKDKDIPVIYCELLTSTDLNYYFDGEVKIFDIKKDPMPPSGSFIAVSRHFYQSNTADKSVPPERKYENLNKRELARIGKTIIVYQLQ